MGWGCEVKKWLIEGHFAVPGTIVVEAETQKDAIKKLEELAHLNAGNLTKAGFDPDSDRISFLDSDLEFDWYSVSEHKP